MAKETFPYSAATLRSLQQQREQLEDEERRRAVRSQCLTRRFLSESRPSFPTANRRLQYCRDIAIHNALYTGDVEKIKGIFKEDGSAEVLVETVSEELQWSPEMGLFSLTPKRSHTSPLRITAGQGYSDCVRHLICHGANPNTLAGERGALHDSCESHHTECTQMLLSRGADPNLLTKNGEAPLHICSTKESLECAKLLLDYGALINLPCHYTRATPLHVASSRGLEEHVALYLSLGADPCARNREGETPLNSACAACEYPQDHARYLRLVEMLLKAGVDPRMPGKKGHGPLHNASANCHLGLVQLLLDKGASVNATNCAGFTPLDCTLQVCLDYECQTQQVVQTLLNHGAELPDIKMWRFCASSPLAFEILLNAYDRIPPGNFWVQSVPTKIWEMHRTFYESVLQVINQPRRLQHLARCAVRNIYKGLCYKAVADLRLPATLTAYLLLVPEGAIH
ncbi:ankyrin repeat and SOCS box protein 16 isoform X1 [Ranitomeya variabilis]|uniref:ankyrin repeat and SOCS box protein 16 isoform X1 n=1 Tax=Ranitomeya variabilis TaxID=490064 RepID=UPI0040560E2D